MDNSSLASQFELLSKLMTLHEENPFKIRSYANAAFQIDRLPQPVESMSEEAIGQVQGIGPAIQSKIETILNTGRFPLLEKYLEQTPPGILEMLRIKGLGPKKIAIIWKKLGIETPGELLYACNEDRLTRYKGFGAKTQESIRQSIAYYLQSSGHYLYADAAAYAAELLHFWKRVFGENITFIPTGDLRRQMNTLSELHFITNAPGEKIKANLPEGFRIEEEESQKILLSKDRHPKVILYFSTTDKSAALLFETTGNTDFLQSFYKKYPAAKTTLFESEEMLFQKAGCPYIPPFLRDRSIEACSELPIIEPADIRGIIHSHSTWSDGKNSIEEMAKAAQNLGMEYLVISDHSQSAGYANGLKPERILAQQEEIDALNKKLAPFKIFKSIESDILSDGSLDYEEEILCTFDLVIASVHSNLKMDQAKAMQRLLTAIQNPYTTILGHPTGRLLLSRPGYPIDHKAIIDACVKHHVVIEINAHPRRLDLDWTWIPYALEQKALLSIDPDAHSLKGIEDIRFGVLSAQKGGLPAKQNLSSFSLNAFESYLLDRKKEKGC